MAEPYSPLKRAQQHQSRTRSWLSQFGQRAGSAVRDFSEREGELARSGIGAAIGAGAGASDYMRGLVEMPALEFGAGLLGADVEGYMNSLSPAPAASAPAPAGGLPAGGVHSRQGELDAIEEMYNSDPEQWMQNYGGVIESNRQPGEGQRELDEREAMYNANPYAFMESTGDKGGGGAARSAELAAGGFTEFAPGQGYKGPALKGGGTVSMMAGSPEAERRATSASRMEDLEQAAAESRMAELAADPLGIRKQQLLAQNDVSKAVAIERGKVGAQSEARAGLRDEYAQEQQYYADLARQRESEVMASNMAPNEKAERVRVIRERADELRRNLREAYGFSERIPAGISEQ